VQDLRIIPAAIDDAEDLFTIGVSCRLSPWTLEGYKAELIRQDVGSFVAKTDKNEAIGFIIGRIPLRSDAAEIYNIGVLPHFRKRGVGKALLEAFLGKCRDRCVAEIWLEARASNNEAINFYLFRGFENTGRRSNFYENPQEDAELMSLKLSSTDPLTKS
jgi:[ribosomal protein S18]-alanine N-acetyltransferase